MYRRSLHYFQAVAEYGSISRAAESLRISQPAISRQIARLEDDLACTLFARHGHGVALTEAGRMLLERGQIILRQIEQTEAEIRGGSGLLSGSITLAVPPAAGLFLVPELVKRCEMAYPNVSLKLVAGYSGYIHEWLVRGVADLACLHDPLPQRGFEIVPLVREEVFLVGKRGAFPFRGQYVGARQLASLPLILPSRPNASRRMLDSWVSARGLSLNVKIEADDSSIIRALLVNGVGFSLLSRGAFQFQVQHKELEARSFRPKMFWPLALVMAANPTRSALIGAIARLIQDSARDLSRSGAWLGATEAR
jgi:LysR family nitrogen assimilation transcriptional regulator